MQFWIILPLFSIFDHLQVKWRCRGVLNVGLTIAVYHPSIKIPMNYLLLAEDGNVVRKLFVITVGLGHQKNGSWVSPGSS